MLMRSVLVALCCMSAFSFASIDVTTNHFDQRAFDYLRLDNGLKILLISDPEAEKSAVALDVNVGSGEDPVARFGLAHFLEHMLFLGTEKYPVPGTFQDFIAGHGGNHNAYTSLMHTNYFFDVNTDQLEEAIDRFSEFFVSPLFLEEYVERERQAVHSEFTSKFSQASRRDKDAFRELVVAGHSLAKFSTGNKSTLGDVEPGLLRRELIDFYRQYYSANIMTLVVSSSLPLDRLKSVVEKRFARVKNTHVKFSSNTIPVFPKDFLPAQIHIQPKKQRRKLSIAFPVPKSENYVNEKPLYYIGNILGHEGSGSLFHVLKNKGWATALSAGTQVRWRDGEMFGVNIYLTEKGFQNVDYIYALVFEAIKLIKEKGISRWRFDELSDMSQVSFKYSERGDSIREVSRLANLLHDTPVNDIFWEPYKFTHFDEHLIDDYLRQMVPENALVTLVAPENLANRETGRQSHFYQTPYRVLSKSESLIHQLNIREKAKVLRELLKLPRPNPFIAKNFKILEHKNSDAVDGKPRLIESSHSLRGWYLNDNIYDLPKTAVIARVKLPQIALSAEDYVAGKIYARLIKDSLNQTSYDAALAGLSYSLVATTRGFDIDFYGYSDSINVLSKHVIDRIRKLGKSKRLRERMVRENFAHVKNELLRIQKNRKHNKVYSQLLAELPAYLYSPFWTGEEIETAFKSITQEQFLDKVSRMFDGGDVEVLVFGNASKRQAKRHIKRMAKLVTSSSKMKVPEGRVVNLSGQPPYLNTLAVDSDDAAVLVYVQAEDDSLDSRVRLGLLEKMISTPLYHTLRTEQQLGYIVFGSNYPVRNVPGILIGVQSPSYDAQLVYERIRAFFNENGAKIFENFERDKRALILELSEKPKNQIEWSDRYWNSILEYDESFDRIQQMLNLLGGISADSLKEDYKKLFVDRAPSLTYVTSKALTEPHDVAKGLKRIEDSSQFKSRMPGYFYP